MKSLLATLPLALLGMVCGQACWADTISFECCSPTVDLPDVTYHFGRIGSMSDVILSVPTSNPSNAAGLTALMALTEAGTHQSEAMLIIPPPPLGQFEEILNFRTVLFTSFATGATATDVSFSFVKLNITEKRTPIPTPATPWLLLSGLAGLWLFAPKRAA